MRILHLIGTQGIQCLRPDMYNRYLSNYYETGVDMVFDRLPVWFHIFHDRSNRCPLDYIYLDQPTTFYDRDRKENTERLEVIQLFY